MNKIIIFEVILVFLSIFTSIYSLMLYMNMNDQLEVYMSTRMLRDHSVKEINAEINQLDIQKTQLNNQIKQIKDQSSSNIHKTFNPDKLEFLEYNPKQGDAIITIIARPNNHYLDENEASSRLTGLDWMGTLGVMAALRETMTRVPNLVVLSKIKVTDDEGIDKINKLPKNAIEAFKRLDIELIEIEGDFEDTREIEQWSWEFENYEKLRGTTKNKDLLKLYGLTQYDRILYISPDSLIVDNIDHLFNEFEYHSNQNPGKNVFLSSWELPCNQDDYCSDSNKNNRERNVIPEDGFLSNHFFLFKPNQNLYNNIMDNIDSIKDYETFEENVEKFNIQPVLLDNQVYGVPVERCSTIKKDEKSCYDPSKVKHYSNSGCFSSTYAEIHKSSYGWFRGDRKRMQHFWTLSHQSMFDLYHGVNQYCYHGIYTIWSDIVINALYPENNHPIYNMRKTFSI
eukprot:TRINITY_DN15893_c0_g1_i1.p1 TRINITY_DN15893_c0_g1~~TRINITY_DN15893_c0_g1_i1.p1  ORF type:complete len:454 (-),score=110.70 TRINITY_DN15893_c0_g1_i1:135-1496(-)